MVPGERGASVTDPGTRDDARRLLAMTPKRGRRDRSRNILQRLDHAMPTEPRSAIRRLEVAAAVVVLLMVATVLRGNRAPIPQLWGAVLVFLSLWLTASKLTSRRPGPDLWYLHVTYFLFTVFVVLGGLLFCFTGGANATTSVRAIGGLVAAVGVVMVIAEVHDFRLWRAEARRESWGRGLWK